MPRSYLVPAVILPLTLACSALAEPAFDVVLNQAQSSVSATLTVNGESSSDTSPVTGSMRIKLNAAGSPTSIELHDFAFAATQSLDFSMVYRVFGIPVGSITANATNVAVEYATPGIIEGPVPISVGTFTFTDVPANSSGNAGYNATGVVCTLIQGQNLPCNGTLDLAETGTQNASTLPGTISVANRVATVSGSINISGPLDPENPTLGSLQIVGTFVGTGTIPYCPGDFDHSGAVAVPDIFAFLSAWFSSSASADVDGIPGIGVPDIFAFLSAWFAPCP